MCSCYSDEPVRSAPVETESIYDPFPGESRQVPKPSKKVSVTREESPKPRPAAVAPPRREAC